MPVHTCPRCDLRFELQSELRAHLIADHGVDPDAVAEPPPPGLDGRA